MKQALKDKKVYLLAIPVFVLGLIPFALGGILSIPSLNAGFPGYMYLAWALTLIFFFVGFIWGDLYQVVFRRKNKNWDGPLPVEITVGAWKRRLPWWLAFAILFVICIVFEIIYKATGHYPFY